MIGPRHVFPGTTHLPHLKHLRYSPHPSPKRHDAEETNTRLIWESMSVITNRTSSISSISSSPKSIPQFHYRSDLPKSGTNAQVINYDVNQQECCSNLTEDVLVGIVRNESFFNLSTTEAPLNASNETEIYNLPRISSEIQIVFYSIIFVLALVGNLLIIITLIQNKRMRTVTNVFLLNLAISDLLLALVCMPFTLVPVLLMDFIFGAFMCVLIRYLQGFLQGKCHQSSP
ncbi:hypothetical protein Btru_077975 [Bulinus truncatus]|nr:hypothetical protein Btru_077975 [Bulinus truncatus]